MTSFEMQAFRSRITFPNKDAILAPIWISKMNGTFESQSKNRRQSYQGWRRAGIGEPGAMEERREVAAAATERLGRRRLRLGADREVGSGWDSSRSRQGCGEPRGVGEGDEERRVVERSFFRLPLAFFFFPHFHGKGSRYVFI